MKVSVLCANYNNGKYLDDFFSSILQSSIIPDEIIFVDDCSTDRSIQVLQKYKDALNIVEVLLKKNIGFANALNLGVSHCTGEFILRVDPDDLIAKDRLELQRTYLIESDLDVVGSQAKYFFCQIIKDYWAVQICQLMNEG